MNVGAIVRLVARGAFEADGRRTPGKAAKSRAPITVNQDILRAVGLVRTPEQAAQDPRPRRAERPALRRRRRVHRDRRAKIEAAGGIRPGARDPDRAARRARRRASRPRSSPVEVDDAASRRQAGEDGEGRRGRGRAAGEGPRAEAGAQAEADRRAAPAPSRRHRPTDPSRRGARRRRGRLSRTSDPVFDSLLNAFRAPDIRRRILYVLGSSSSSGSCSHVPVPGVDPAAARTQFLQGNPLFGLLDLFSGGGLSSFSVVALGMNPYINASIIMQLMPGVVPRSRRSAVRVSTGATRSTSTRATCPCRWPCSRPTGSWPCSTRRTS